MFKNENIKRLWSNTKPKVWEGHYWMVSFSPEKNDIVSDIVSKALRGKNYHSLIRDQHEISLILHDTIWAQYQDQQLHRNEFGPLSGITFDIAIDIEVSGYLAPMVKKMAENNVSIVPQCALVYDHIFVRANDVALATSIIKDLIDQALTDKIE